MEITSDISTIDLGIMPYREAWDLQHQYQQEIIDSKKKGENFTERLLVVEHPHVFTLGFHGNANNLLASSQWLERQGIEVVRIERGGDITYHGPGQIVLYPIIDLEKHHLGIKSYIHLLEESVIQTLQQLGIKAGRVENATGVWVNIGEPNESKICAIGVKCSRFVTMHGLALNVNTDLSYFNAINPCGFIDKGVASIEQILEKRLDINEVKNLLTATFLSLLSSSSN